MKIIQINTTCGVGSTGKIAVQISQLLTNREVENEILYSRASSGAQNGKQCGKNSLIKFEAIKSRILGNYGFNSILETKKIIEEIDNYSPDAILLHNIHGHDCNISILFSYFKQKQKKLYWTFHDCWAFTGYCTYFTLDKCNKWVTGCYDCPQYRQYSWFFDRSKELYQRKKKLFSGLDLTIITPSKWLAELVGKSFLNNYPVRVINNGIDLSIFKPTTSAFRDKYHISWDKFIILGVAFGWEKRKGLDVFLEMARSLNEDEYQIVLVGTDDKVDKILTKNIISIHRTQNQQELVEIYTASDVFVNPTREENYPTVNMESIACGTPVVSFRTGGSPEIIDDCTGSIVDVDDIKGLVTEIQRIKKERPYTTADCVQSAKKFDINKRLEKYVDLIEGDNNQNS